MSGVDTITWAPSFASNQTSSSDDGVTEGDVLQIVVIVVMSALACCLVCAIAKVCVTCWSYVCCCSKFDYADTEANTYVEENSPRTRRTSTDIVMVPQTGRSQSIV